MLFEFYSMNGKQNKIILRLLLGLLVIHDFDFINLKNYYTIYE